MFFRVSRVFRVFRVSWVSGGFEGFLVFLNVLKFFFLSFCRRFFFEGFFLQVFLMFLKFSLGFKGFF